jgi:two-component system, cell cycle response regulator
MRGLGDFETDQEDGPGVGPAIHHAATVRLRLLGEPDTSATAVTQQIAELEMAAYVSLIGLDDQALRLADRADSLSLPDVAFRARLLHSDVLSRRGETDVAMRLQVALHDRAKAEGRDLLAARACLYLASTADRAGQRRECLKWAGAAQLSMNGAPTGWRAEALMVLALFTVSHVGFKHALLEHTLKEVRAVANPVLTTVTLANLAEVATECGDLQLGQRLVDEAIELLHHHPSASAALTWESIAQVHLASGDLEAADRAVGTSLRLGGRLGWCDVNGDAHLTLAELRLAQGDSEAALVALAHPEGAAARAQSSWLSTRELQVRAKILASLEKWHEAYDTMVAYAAAYERIRSAEAERAAAESQSDQTAEEERRRASKFEQLSLRDPLTGLYNRRYADEWLSTLTGLLPGACDGRFPGLLSVAILDIDDFKDVNDTYSHDVGDLVLVRLSELLLGETDVFSGQCGGPTEDSSLQPFTARLGGEEFVLVFPGISHDEAIAACEQLLRRLRETSFTDLAPGLTVNASIGLVTLATPTDRAEMMRTADACLYEAKRAGRDRLVATAKPLAVARRVSDGRSRRDRT